ncbi:unnamed protein product [Zymoseptoria tritici ST99CH_1E4]|uniref:F-box domain-containing protein n=1 Tax=Zymoseptoria tritici ST99CH_1E4 TaxID=1276532 RepID=A0A2H1GCW6_ZYMTR|nr:unnamed protein product [Zymoseptoria tritici ST99CH_1E4]
MSVSSPSRPATKMEDSRLGRLPPELRNIIFELVLTIEEAIVITARSAHYKIRRPTFAGVKDPLALLRVCKQANIECTKILYGTNTFNVTLSPEQTRLTTFLEITEKEKSMNEIHLLDRFCVSLGKQALAGLCNIEVTAFRHFYSSLHTMVRQIRYLKARDVFIRNTNVEYTLLRKAANNTEDDIVLTIRMHCLKHDLEAAISRLRQMSISKFSAMPPTLTGLSGRSETASRCIKILEDFLPTIDYEVLEFGDEYGVGVVFVPAHTTLADSTDIDDIQATKVMSGARIP